jgi:hypothetical protein
MPKYRIRMINSEFESIDDADYPSLQAARMAAIVTATTVATESIAAGAPTAAVELQIHVENELVMREVVTISVADLSGGE